MKTLTRSQEDSIQILRGLAIAAVVFIHNTPDAPAYQILCRPFLNFCVGLFLFLSGMLSCADRWNPWKRIRKLLVPYILWTLAYVVQASWQTPGAIAGAFLRGLLQASTAPVMYYVYVYIQFTLLIPAIDRLARSRWRMAGFLISPAEILLMRLIPMLAGHSFPYWVNLILANSCLYMFSFFYMGYLLGNGLLTIPHSSRKLLWWLVLATLWQMGEGYWFSSLGVYNCGTQRKLSSVAASVLVSLLAWRFLQSGKASRAPILKTLGDHSFGIFFCHVFLMRLLGSWHVALPAYPLSALAILALSLAFCLAGRKLLGPFAKYLAL